MNSFSITHDNQTLTVVSDALEKTALPAILRLTRDLDLAPYGVIPEGALARTKVLSDGVLALTFIVWWKALRHWDNVLLLFPDCVEMELFSAFQSYPAVTPFVRNTVDALSGLVA